MRIGLAHFGITALFLSLLGACSDDPPDSGQGNGGGTAGTTNGGGGEGGGSAGTPSGESGGGGETGGASGGDSGSGAGGTAGSGTGGSAGLANCNTLVNTADLVTSVLIESDAPAPEGGTLVDGVYEVTAVQIYDTTGSATTDTRRRTVELRYGGTIWDWVSDQDADEFRIQAFFEAVGNDLLVTTLCSNGATLAPRYGYTASADRILTFYTDNVDRVTVTTFTARR